MYPEQYAATIGYLNTRERLNRIQLVNEDIISDHMIEERKKLIFRLGIYAYGLNAHLIGGRLWDYGAVIDLSRIGRENVAVNVSVDNPHDSIEHNRRTMRIVRAGILEAKYLYNRE